MDVNERIALALGWKLMGFRLVKATPDGWITDIPDYAHSLDACLPVLADRPEWAWSVRRSVSRGGKYFAAIEWLAHDSAFLGGPADTPAAALAECLADALEAEKSPD